MTKELNGYVIYCKENNRNTPIGVVSESFDCKATTDYIPNRLKDFIVEIEDRRFYQHNGIDYKGISRAILENMKAGKIIQGGSTISQQLARNLLKDNRKTLYRKLKETLKALQIEQSNTKDEILKLYFNNVYFGKNIWGIRAAGLYYFGKETEKLNQSELLYLITILRGPNYYSKRPEIALRRYKAINDILFERKLLSKNRIRTNLSTKFILQENYLQSIKNVSIPFITANVDNKHKKIYSTLENHFQNFAKQFVSESKYPVSIIALKKGTVVGFASSYGTDYPFISKSNVGSTLKPFLYVYLREKGISKHEEFSSFKNDLDWDVREVKYYKSRLNIQEALYYSNNNAFLNASNKVGMENTLNYLSDIFNRDKNDFFPSSILGATKSGISIYELAFAYSSFFNKCNISETKRECIEVLNKVFYEKLGFNIENAFLKTGTTNDNKERFAILGDTDLTFAILRNENSFNDDSKEGNFLIQISRSFSSLFKLNNSFTWI